MDIKIMRCGEMSAARLDAIVGGFGRVDITVIGDYCLDRYGEGEVKGVSRETGDPIGKLWWHSFAPGGCGNVACNVASLGARVRATSVLGSDDFGAVILHHLVEAGIAVDGVVQDPNRITGSYEKLQIADAEGGAREVRVDVDNKQPVSQEAERRLLDEIGNAAEWRQAIVAADYNEVAVGVLTEAVTRAIAQAGANKDLLVAAISRTRVIDFAPAMLVVNEYEACHATGVAAPGIFDDVPDAVTARAAQALVERTGRPSFVTMGSRGVLVTRTDGTATRVATMEPHGPIDITGAGDSALAGIVLSLAVGASPEEAAIIGNLAAYVTIHKVRAAGTATPAELREAHAMALDAR